MKTCKVCKSKFKPTYSTVQMVCSPKCAIEYSKQRKEKNKSSLSKAEKQRKEQSDLKKAMKTTELAVHKFVRERDKGKPCVSCGTQWREDFQACHLFSRKQYSGLRFNLDNVHGGCRKCNLYEDGNIAEYTLRLPDRIGQERFDKLIKLARLEKQYIKQWTIHELKEIRNNLKK